MKRIQMQVLDILKPAPYMEPITDKVQIEAQYAYWRLRICYSIFMGYAGYYLTRKSFAMIMPFMVNDLGFSKAQMGILLSLFALSYGISKFLSGIISDRSNPRYFMSIGLLLTGVANIAFGVSSSLPLLGFFWIMNGFFQAWGWPPCCKSLTYWFKRSNRGLWYSVCSTSHNVGGGVIALLAPVVAVQYGWRYAMFIPAIISIVMGLFLMNRLRDVPQSLGLPPIEDTIKSHQSNQSHTTNHTTTNSKQHSLLSLKEVLFKQILNNKYVWIFALCYVFIYFVRSAINDWSPFYLLEVKGFTDAASASRGIVWFEVGGVVGMIATGWGSDYLFKGNRIPTMIISALGLIVSSMALFYSPPGSPAWLDFFYLACIGGFVGGPQVIVGLAAAEFVDKRAAATSNGFVGIFGYIGVALAGYPTAKIIELWSWYGFYSIIISASLSIFLILIPLWWSDLQEKKTFNQLAKNVC